MRRILLAVMLFGGVMPAVIQAATAESKTIPQGTVREAGAAGSKVKSAQTVKLTKSKKNVVLITRMKDPQGGVARADKNAALPQKTAPKLPQAQKTGALSKQTLAPQAIVQTVRPQSKAGNKPAQAKAGSKDATSTRNVLVH